mmetsp:Transcript_21809/g.52738  ORF Transcript_21809/g.52738 Transcript_21809/m.52738 type:complete len:204 (-) Transcript_21809:1207-1818(-)
MPPRCVKLSTKGVRPMMQFSTISKNSTTKTLAWLILAPRSLANSLKSKFQFMMISDIQAPIKPKIPPDAPTVMYSGKKMALKIVPPIAGTTNCTTAGKKPCICSIALPTNHNASILNKKWISPACSTMGETSLHISSCTTIKYESFAPSLINVSALGPIIGLTDKGSNFQSFTRMDVNIIAVHAETIRKVKNGRLNPSFFMAS